MDDVTLDVLNRSVTLFTVLVLSSFRIVYIIQQKSEMIPNEGV